MIHYGKKPSGDLEILVSADNVGEVYETLESAGLLQRRTFNGLKQYIRSEFAHELERHRYCMTAQMPLTDGGSKLC